MNTRQTISRGRSFIKNKQIVFRPFLHFVQHSIFLQASFTLEQFQLNLGFCVQETYFWVFFRCAITFSSIAMGVGKERLLLLFWLEKVQNTFIKLLKTLKSSFMLVKTVTSIMSSHSAPESFKTNCTFSKTAIHCSRIL